MDIIIKIGEIIISIPISVIDLILNALKGS